MIACELTLGALSYLRKGGGGGDDHLIKKSAGIDEIRVADPITFIREELE